MIERYEIEICRNSGIGDKSALLAAWIAAVTLLSLVPIEQSQAQLILTIHPLQDHTNNTTLWTFSGSSTADQVGGTILGAQSQSPVQYNNGSDGALQPSAGDELFPASAPSRYSAAALYSLTVNPTNMPRITLGSETRTFSHLFMFNGTQGTDAIGIRCRGQIRSVTMRTLPLLGEAKALCALSHQRFHHSPRGQTFSTTALTALVGRTTPT